MTELDQEERTIRADVERPRDLVAQNDGVGVPALRDMFTEGSDARSLRERFDRAVSSAHVGEAVLSTGGARCHL
jgi:hypothetical protein